MSKLRWQDMVLMVLGLCIAAAPWALAMADALPVATWNAVIVGMLILALAAIDLDTPARWEEWVLGALGLWLVVAPWVLGYSTSQMLMAGSVAAGSIVIVLAAWELYAGGGSTHHGRTAH